MVGSIICGVDDSASAQGAARVARRLSRTLGLSLVFVRVVDSESADEEISAIAERLERLTGAASGVDCGAQWVVDVGHPADRLVAAAADASASMIVVGSHGPRSSLLGSISADVAKRAPCPVVVVPPGADDVLNDGRGFPGGIARFDLADGGGVSGGGGIVRFGSARVARRSGGSRDRETT
jgi:nucleotide-binding universal stress UspA family protein